MGDASGSNNYQLKDSPPVLLTGKVIVVAIIIIVFFLVLALVLFLHVYAKLYFYRRPGEDVTTTARRQRRRRFDFAPGHLETAAAIGLRRGLDKSALNSLPVVMFNPKDFKEGIECGVCLSELADGEKARLLPKCNHGFHVDCIDMWFQSHSTCPLCRNPVSTQSPATPESILHPPRSENPSTESANLPTNVLFWGNENQVSALGTFPEEGREAPVSSSQPPNCSSSSLSPSTNNRPDGVVVIDIPSQIGEDEEQKSPVPTRLRSLKRLLSRDRDRRVNPHSPGADLQ